MSLCETAEVAKSITVAQDGELSLISQKARNVRIGTPALYTGEPQSWCCSGDGVMFSLSFSIGQGKS
jgi:hypothetical protein